MGIEHVLRALASFAEKNAIALAAVGLSIWTFFSNHKGGKLVFHSPNFMAAHQYSPGNGGQKSQDMIIVPVAVASTGTKQRSLTLKLMVNGKDAFHHHVTFDVVRIPPQGAPFTTAGVLALPTPIVFNRPQTQTVIAGFTQAGVLPLPAPLICDLWYNEGKGWKQALRIQWDSFTPKDYGTGLSMSSRGFTVHHKFAPSYGQTIVDQ